MELKEAIEYALDNDAILFLGAGASVGAINKNNEPIKVGAGLIHLLCKEAGVKDSKTLSLATEHYCDSKKSEGLDAEQELIELLRNQFLTNEIADFHKLYPLVPWKRIYTTNYDDIVEKSYYLAGKTIMSYTLDEKRHGSQDVEYIHINGSIKRLDKNSLHNQFKLTDESYNTNAFIDDYWGKLFVQDIKTYSSIIFLGFSLENDLDLRRLIFHNTYREKCIFIVHQNEDDDNIKIMSKYGVVYKIGSEEFFDKVIKVKASYMPKNNLTLEETVFTNFDFRRNEQNEFTEEASDLEVQKYYTTGNRVPNLYFPDEQGYKSIVKRSVVQSIINDIESHKVDLVFIHSDIGNGKTETIKQISLAVPAKYNVFVLKDINEKLHKEIEIICSSNKKAIIIIENFFNHNDVFDLFKLHNKRDNIFYIFTSRTSIYKNQYEIFAEDMATVTYNLNSLDDNEIENFVKIFDNYGYYFNKNNENEFIMRKDCKRKIQAIMLKLFQNSNIINELTEAINNITIQKNKRYINFITYILIINIMSLEIDFYDILELFDDQKIDFHFGKDPNINEFINLHESKINIKSPALSVWLINQLPIKNLILPLLIRILKKADDSWKVNKNFENVLRNVVSFKHLKFLFDILSMGRKEKYNLINDFYESVKNLDYYKNRYFFWLQYGIAALEMGDFLSAEMHINAAYAKCSKDMNPFEIDNQSARLKIEMLLLPEETYSENTIIQIEEIHKLLTPTSAPADDEYYCYKMANAYYRKLFEKFNSSMKEPEKERIREIVSQNYNLCKEFSRRTNNQNLISKLEKFEKEFMKLSLYEDNIKDSIEGEVTYILEYYVKIEFFKDGKLEKGQIYRPKVENKIFHIGDLINVKLNDYNIKHKCWNLVLV